MCAYASTKWENCCNVYGEKLKWSSLLMAWNILNTHNIRLHTYKCEIEPLVLTVMFISQGNLSFYLLTSQHLDKSRQMKCKHNTQRYKQASKLIKLWGEVTNWTHLRSTWAETKRTERANLIWGGRFSERNIGDWGRSRRNSGGGGTVHHGNFYSGVSDERQRTRMWAGRRGGDRNDMVTMAKCAGSKVMAQVQWYCQDEFEQVSRHMQEREKKFIYTAKWKKRQNYTHKWTKKQGNTPSYNPIRLENLIIVFKWMGQVDGGSEWCENSLSAFTGLMSTKLTSNS